MMKFVDQDVGFIQEYIQIKKKDETTIKANNMKDQLVKNMRKRFTGQKMKDQFFQGIKNKFNFGDAANQQEKEMTEEEKKDKKFKEY